ncbi:MAG: hypothetical protein NC417_00725 [Candidatus Gastranaerophilales bacterium]|nr:hypothetical protein [Candidatus Gastranaerophilales bacterium]
MKIIISHDVDHLYSTEHWRHDLIIPKLWVRSLIYLCRRQINFKVFLARVIFPFQKKWNRTAEVLQFDKEHYIPSTFFFGMSRGLGMSYGAKIAEEMIQYVCAQGYDVGVHGIAFSEDSKMQEEYTRFKKIVGAVPVGIRMHYVRKDESTFEKLAQIGYLFDSTEFDKTGTKMVGPYKIHDMWEIPLHVMDGYVMDIGDAEQSKENTIRIIEKVKEQELPYCTVLFHDFYYNAKCYPQEKEWYDWLIQYLQEQNYEFISFKDAVKELERRDGCENNRMCK